MESSNPGGTGKDRAVKYMLDEAEKSGKLKPGMTVFEGTSGSTGIALAFQCRARGYPLHVVMPDDQAEEKRNLLRKLGATVTVVSCCSIANSEHYVNTARRLAKEAGGFFVDQFENESNYAAHFAHTGPEIWRQTRGHVDAFVMSSGTGGTIAGVSR
jgi:cysteine synthase